MDARALRQRARFPWRLLLAALLGVGLVALLLSCAGDSPTPGGGDADPERTTPHSSGLDVPLEGSLRTGELAIPLERSLGERGADLEGDLDARRPDRDERRPRERDRSTTPGDGAPSSGNEVAPGVELEPCRSFVLRDPTFETNQAEVTPAGRAEIAALVRRLRTVRCGLDSLDAACDPSHMMVELHGHTDDRPTDRDGGNEQLSLDRAMAVGEIFESMGVAVQRVEGHGAAVPAAAPIPDRRTVDERRGDDRRTEVLLRCAG